MEIKQNHQLPEHPKPIAIIGVGGIVKDAHLPAYTLARWKVMGVYDLDMQKSEAAKNDFPLIEKVYASLGELIREAFRQKAVFDLAVPADQVLKVLNQLPNGSAVLIQKPMGESLAAAKSIQELCIQKELVAAVNFQLKFAPYILAAKDLIQRGLLGELYDLEVKVCVYTPWDLWDFLLTKPRMEVLYHSVHYLDLIRSILGDPKKIHASVLKSPKTKKLADARSTIILDYNNYTQAKILTNHSHDYGSKNQESYFKIEGTEGAIKITIGLSLEYPKGKPPKMEYYLQKEKIWKEVPLEGAWFPHAFIGSMAALQVHVNNPKSELHHGIADSIKTMKLVEAVYQASQRGGLSLENIL